MSHPLISHSPDLSKLRDDGYEIEIIENHLVVRSVPHVNEARQVRRGVLAIALNQNAGVTRPPNTHVIMFAGDFPCDEHGKPLEKLRHGGEKKKVITDNLVMRFTFSNKPPDGYKDYYQLITTYIANISGPAEVLDSQATARTWRVIENTDPESVFVYSDTASSRAGITAVTSKLKIGAVAIVGLGGTGSYVLDLVAKTPVAKIDLFDRDRFGQHNAFRSPGAPSLEELKTMPSKVGYFASIYSRMRRGIVPHEYNIDASNVAELAQMAFVFLCMDAGKDKKVIVEKLEELGIPFVDVGMGLHLSEDDNVLRGILRITTSTKEKRDHVRSNHRLSFDGDGENVYDQNIQIADMNALNAALAVEKWKKLFGFYDDRAKEHFSTFTIDGNSLVNEDKT